MAPPPTFSRGAGAGIAWMVGIAASVLVLGGFGAGALSLIARTRSRAS